VPPLQPGRNPKEAAIYFTHSPAMNDGKTPISLTIKDVPLVEKGFWGSAPVGAESYGSGKTWGSCSILAV
jgi:hypothetical protein